MSTMVVIGILGLAGGAFGLLILQVAGCNPVIGDTLMTLVALSCPIG